MDTELIGIDVANASLPNLQELFTTRDACEQQNHNLDPGLLIVKAKDQTVWT